MSYFYKSRVPTLNHLLAPWYGKLWAGVQYLLGRRGPLAMSVNQAGGFVRSRPELTRPNLQLYFNPLSYAMDALKPGRIRQPDPFPGFLLSFNSCRPGSRGRVSLRSADPLAKPVIETHFLTTAEDRQDALEGMALLRQLAATQPMAQVISSEVLPGEEVRSKAQMMDDFSHRAGSVYHASCTCAMGRSASDSVVDSQLRVHGLLGLRVVDASVFPNITSGNTNAPTLMVAEKGAEMILQSQR